MPPVPAPCSALADQVASIEAEEASLRAALADLTGFVAWTALVRLSRVRDELAKFRTALAACIEHADSVFPGELVVIDLAGADPTPATGDRVIELWEVTSAGAAVHEYAPVTGTFFALTRPLPQQCGITVLATDMARLAAGSDVPRDFQSAPITPTALPLDGPLRVEVMLGPQVRLTVTEVNGWVAGAALPDSQPLPGVLGGAIVSVTGRSAALIDDGIRGTVTGSLQVQMSPFLGAVMVPFSISVGVAVRISTAPLSHIVELAPLGPPEIHLTGDLGPLASALSSAAGDFVTGLVMNQLQEIVERELPAAVAHALALPALPVGATVTIRQLAITPPAISFQPTLGTFGTALSTFTAPPIPVPGQA